MKKKQHRGDLPLDCTAWTPETEEDDLLSPMDWVKGGAVVLGSLGVLFALLWWNLS